MYPFISECIKEENGETAVIQLVDLSDTYGAGSEGISRESAGMEWIDPEMLKKQTENVTDICGGDMKRLFFRINTGFLEHSPLSSYVIVCRHLV